MQTPLPKPTRHQHMHLAVCGGAEIHTSKNRSRRKVHARQHQQAKQLSASRCEVDAGQHERHAQRGGHHAIAEALRRRARPLVRPPRLVRIVRGRSGVRSASACT